MAAGWVVEQTVDLEDDVAHRRRRPTRRIAPHVQALLDRDADEAVPEPVLVHIDRALGGRVWAGTRTEDRALHLERAVALELMQQIERSLMAQDSFDDFTARLDRQFGIGPQELRAGSTPLRRLEQAVEHEARLAWNRGTLAATAAEPEHATVPLWASALLPTTTPGCWASHGRRIDTELEGVTPQRHQGCKCYVLSVPDPDALDAEWAAQGAVILAAMAEERGEDAGDPFAESAEAESGAIVTVAWRVPEGCHVGESVAV